MIDALPTVGASVGIWGTLLNQYLNDLRSEVDSSVKQGDLVLNVRDTPYGAAGDGVSDDAAAINSAVTAAAAFGVGEVLVPPSAAPYMLGSALNLKSGVTLRVNGTLQMLGSSTSAAINIQNVSNVRVVGTGVIDMNKAETTNGNNSATQQAIYIHSSTTAMSDVRVLGVTIQNGWQRGVAVVEGGFAISDVRVVGCSILNMGDRGVSVVQNTGQRVVVSLTDCESSGSQGICVTAGTDVRIVGCNVTNAGDHAYVLGGNDSASSVVTRASVLGCTASGAAKFGFVVSMRCTEWAVNGCVATGCTQGGYTVDVERTNSLTVLQDAPGTISGCVANCSNIAASIGVQVRYAKGVSVTGNTVYNAPAEGIYLVNSVGTVVSGNNIIGCGVGVKASQAAGVSSGDYRVYGNYCSGNTTDYDLSGTSILNRCDFQQSYTPTWTQSSTAPTLNSGTLVGKYVQIGEMVQFNIVLTIGSDTTFGSGAFEFTLPSGVNVLRASMSGHLLHSGTQYSLVPNVNNAVTGLIVVMAPPTTAGGPVISMTNTTPVALAAGDLITITGSYIAAS